MYLFYMEMNFDYFNPYISMFDAIKYFVKGQKVIDIVFP